MKYNLNVTELRKISPRLKAGDRIVLSGTVYTSRDAAHKRIISAIYNGEDLPYQLNDSVVYYAGPTPTPSNLVIGSCGPTTASRMDVFSSEMLDNGIVAMIGKGERNKNVCEAIVRNKAVYLCAIGGAGALASKCITKCEIIAYEDLGCESVKKLEFTNFPLTVAIDCSGGNIFGR